MKMFKLKLEVDLSNPAVVAAMHTLFTAVGGLAATAIAAAAPIVKLAEEAPEVKTKAEKAPRKVKETFTAPGEDKAPEPNPDELENGAGDDFAKTDEANDEVENGDITIQMVRDVLAPKIDANRDTIKAKLTELGAKNVTLLDTKHYAAMHEFLNGLK